MRSRRAWIYVLSVAALLVPAGGIAYLGAVSYRDERGAVAAQIDRQREAAYGIAGRIDQAIESALAAVDPATRATPPPLGRYWFWIDPEQHLQIPRAATVPAETAAALDRAAGCGGDRLEDCVRELTTRERRFVRLHAAQHAEGCRGETCAAAWAEARRQYTTLTAFADTGPQAQLGLARVLARLGDAKGEASALAGLEERFGDRSFEGLPVKLVVAVLRAEVAGPDALLDVAAQVVGHAGPELPPVQQLGVVAQIRAGLDRELTAAQATRRDELDARIAEIRTEARIAAGLADDVAEINRTATPAWRGKPASRRAERTLIYRRRADNSIVGIAVDAAMLEAAAGHDPADAVAAAARPLVLPAGATPPSELRTIAQVPLGAALSHLSVALVNPVAERDPLDEVIRARSRRHVVLTSALAMALGLGLLATIRGAARARELAQLKSDFVSTVSHELKTPLTSIRMFAEMLEQGVAQGDAAKMARYHGVIVQESQRLGLLIANLLDYSQIERGTRRYAPTRQGVVQLVRHAVTTFETLRDPESATPPRNAIEVEVSRDAMQADVEVDRDVIVQAILNLLANATKYGGGDAPIEVSVSADAQHTAIAVRDHGPGIPASEQPRIFREFYRAPEAYRSGVEGTGLGLALVKRHVEALGGTVAVVSTLGQGATFTIRLPRVAEAA